MDKDLIYNEALTKKVIEFLEGYGIDVTYQRFTNYNVQLRCPFASVGEGHSDSVDRNPSFGLKVTNQGFLYNCFTCGERGRSLIEFIEALQSYGLVSESMDAYKLQNSIHPAFREFGAEVERDNPEIVVNKLPGDGASRDVDFIRYNLHRGVKMEIVRLLKIRYVKNKKKIIFPVLGKGSILKGYVEHKIDNAFPKYSNEVNKSENVYLEWLIKDHTAGIIVEGIYDAIITYQHLAELGWLTKYSVVSMMGSKIARRQVEMATTYFSTIILYGDNDYAGIQMEESFHKMAKGKVPNIYRVKYLGNDPAEVDIDSFKVNFTRKVRPFGLTNFA